MQVLAVDVEEGQYHLLWQDGSDAWIHPQEHCLRWVDALDTRGPMHAARPGRNVPTLAVLSTSCRVLHDLHGTQADKILGLFWWFGPIRSVF